MNIIFVFESTYPDYTGGVETWIYNVCERLVYRNNIKIITVEGFRKEAFAGHYDNINENISIIPIKDLNHVPIVRLFIHKHFCFLNSIFTAYCMYKKCRELIDKNETYYVVALGTVFTPIPGVKLQKKYKNIKTVSSCRTIEPELLGQSYPGLGWICQLLQKRNLRKMDEIWANGKDTYRYLNRKGFVSKVIKNGVSHGELSEVEPYDYERLGLRGKRIIVTVGSVSDIKGYKEIIHAVAILKDEYNVEVEFVGVGKVRERHRKKYMSYAKSLSVDKQVHLIGENKNVVAFDKGADVVVCCSGGSGYGHSILEAMVSRTPIVAWDNAAHRQLLKDNVSAKLVKAWDSEKLAEGINYVFANEDEAKKWGVIASKCAERFDWDVVVEEIEQELKGI